MEDTKVNEQQITVFRGELVDMQRWAGSFVVKNDEDLADLVQGGKDCQAKIKRIKEYFEDDIDRANKIHKSLTGKRNDLIKPHNDVVLLIKEKKGVYIHEKEEKARQDEIRLQKEATEAHARKIQIAEKKIEGFLSGIQDNMAKINSLTDKLEAGDCTDEEAEVMRSQIDILQMAVENKQDKVDVAVAKSVEKAPEPTATAPPVKPKNWKATVSNPDVLIKAIVAGRVPIGVVKEFDLVLLQTLRKSGMDCSGVTYTPDYSKGGRL